MDLLDYPSVEEIQYYNTIAIEMFRKSKHDEAKTINVSYMEKAIEKVKGINNKTTITPNICKRTPLLNFELRYTPLTPILKIIALTMN